MPGKSSSYPVHFSVDYPSKPLDRLSTLLRLIFIIPISALYFLVVFSASFLILPTIVMIVVKRKYPKPWFDWNVYLLKFANRIGAYLTLLRDEYPSTDDEQAVHLRIEYPDVKRNLNRWLPLIKWFLAIPHYLVMILLSVLQLIAVVIAYFAILINRRYPKILFDFVVGAYRWSNRVTAYAILMTTDRYPPFRLKD